MGGETGGEQKRSPEEVDMKGNVGGDLRRKECRNK